MIKEMQKLQEKLRTIDKLSNCIQKLDSNQSKEVSYLIHRIVESDYINTTLAREVMGWSLQSNKELFINVSI